MPAPLEVFYFLHNSSLPAVYIFMLFLKWGKINSVIPLCGTSCIAKLAPKYFFPSGEMLQFLYDSADGAL